MAARVTSDGEFRFLFNWGSVVFLRNGPAQWEIVDLTRDELAGIVSLFGGLTHEEMREACTEIAFKQTGQRPEENALETTIENAVQDHYLVTVEKDGETLLVAGPRAFPSVPDFGGDLHHILEIDDRDIDRARAADHLLDSFEAELENGIATGRREELEQLAYDVEAWAGIDTREFREALAAAEES